jgi:signal peptidase I
MLPDRDRLTGRGLVARIGLGVVLVTALIWLVGVRAMTLASTSMAPWADAGALIVHRSVSVDDLRPGDVVSISLDNGRTLTHRVAALSHEQGGAVTLRLRGDANAAVDPEPRTVDGRVLRALWAFEGLGAFLQLAAPLIWSGLGLMLVGWAVLRKRDREPASTQRPLLAMAPSAPLEPTGDVHVMRARGSELIAAPHAVATPSVPHDVGWDPPPTAALDPRIDALLATAEALVEDGMPWVIVRDLVRVRACDLLSLPSVEQSGAVRSLEDGARFYVLALADADADALAVVPVASARRRAGTNAVERWWSAVDAAVPAHVLAALAPWLRETTDA